IPKAVDRSCSLAQHPALSAAQYGADFGDDRKSDLLRGLSPDVDANWRIHPLDLLLIKIYSNTGKIVQQPVGATSRSKHADVSRRRTKQELRELEIKRVVMGHQHGYGLAVDRQSIGHLLRSTDNDLIRD